MRDAGGSDIVRVFFAGGGTGGHLYPALAIARALVREDPRARPFFIGARRGIERDVLPVGEFPFELLELHPLYRARPWQNWRTVIGGVGAYRRVATLAREQRPAALVATGGYVAGVALAHAAVNGVPIIIQEQNSFPGATVRWFARRAAQIHLGFPEAAGHLRTGPATQLLDSGNPIDPPPAARPSRETAIRQWGFDSVDRPTILVFGGSQGAEAINAAVAAWLGEGGAERAGVQVVWATGKGGYDRYSHLDGPQVRVRPYITPMADAYAAADLAVCRSGAMTIAELAAWGIPAIFIPLPTAAADHQTANARALVASGAAELLVQRDLMAATLGERVARLAGAPHLRATMHRAALGRARPDAAANIARHILRLNAFK